ncbi:MAG: hypothetical protein WD077_03510 [Bacteroidia bacterium]
MEEKIIIEPEEPPLVIPRDEFIRRMAYMSKPDGGMMPPKCRSDLQSDNFAVAKYLRCLKLPEVNFYWFRVAHAGLS